MPLPKAPASQTSAVAVAVPTVEVVTESKASAPTTSAPSSSPPPPTLELDGSLTAALEAAVPAGKPKFVLATFGNLGVREQLANFVAYVRRTGAAHVVGAVDVGAFDMMRSLGSPTYKTPLAAQDYKLDGSNQHSSGSWKRFASMRTGEVAKIVHAGFTVLHTDCDVVFLRDPTPYIMCGAGGVWGEEERYPCAGLQPADVAVSSDNMSPDRDHRSHAGYSAGGTFNTGLLLVRPTDAGRRFVDEWHKLVVSPPRGEFSMLTSDQQVFNHMFRRPNEWPGVSAPDKAWLMRGRDMGLGVQLGALPLPLFLNGHGYFVQASHTRLRVPPIAVHATYSLDNHDALAKAQRFREAGLWAVDDDAYYQGKFLALNYSLAPAVQAAVDGYVRKGEAPSNIDVHSKSLASYVAELRDALALATALGRTLVLPRWTCYCDRLWSGSDDIFHFGCMYPGAQDGRFVPFVCPMDHVLSPTGWAKAGVAYRDAAFLERLQERSGGIDLVDVHVGGADGADSVSGGSGVRLPLGLSDQHAARLLAPYAHTRVLRLSHARGLLCGIEGGERADSFGRLLRPPWPENGLLTPPPWCSTCFARCDVELRKWLTPEAIAKGVDRGNPNRWCARWEPPPPLQEAAKGCPRSP